MRNKYGGHCYKCGLWVKPGTGHFERVQGKGWRVQHAYFDRHGGVTCEMAKQDREWALDELREQGS